MTTTTKQFTTGDTCWIGYGQMYGRDHDDASTSPHATKAGALAAIESEWLFWLTVQERKQAGVYARKCRIDSEEGDYQTID